MAVALYARVSTAKQAEKDLSIPDQLKQMREWCKSRGLVIAMEYIEPGASATDDRRPVFRQMMADATNDPSPYEAIIVHSRSRFFRDLFQVMKYEQKLALSCVKVMSITQQTSDDPAGEMASKLFSLFDEYQSKENGKHTLRAMKENACQGYFNGSRPLFGFQVQETEKTGNKGQRKKRLAVDPAEAATVRRIFDLYLHGHQGESLGCKGIASHLNDRGLTYRGSQWTRTRIHLILTQTAYRGDYYFNRINQKTKQVKPETEWIKIPVEPIVDASTFELVGARLQSRAPTVVPPRVVNSPTLLTGLVRCGCCGAGMTLATGKSGRYRYYKCNTRIGKGLAYCSGGSVPMEKLDQLVLTSLADKVFTPTRVQSMLRELQKDIKASRTGQDEKLRELQRELDQTTKAQERLYEAVEQGALALDDSLKSRSHKLQARRQAILTEIAGLKARVGLPAALLRPKHIETFTASLKSVLLNKRGFAKQYLRLLVDDIRVQKRAVTLRGSYTALAQALETKTGTPNGVPRFVPNWLPVLGTQRTASVVVPLPVRFRRAA
jgi:DNA invertase Pin-like site-specific DNA recombinase